MTRVLVVGDSMLDREWTGSVSRLCADSTGPVVELAEEAARPGGASLTAVAAASHGCEVVLVTAIGADEAGDELRRLLRRHRIEVVDIGPQGPTPEKIRIRVDTTTVCRLDRAAGVAAPLQPWFAEAVDPFLSADALVLSDYGRGVVGSFPVTVPHRDDLPVVWDPHPSALRIPPGVTLASPNRAEAAQFCGMEGSPAVLAGELARRWRCAVAVTCGDRGAELSDGGPSVAVPAMAVRGDACGAGDWFAAGAAVALARGADLREATVAGCAAAGRWVGGDHRLDEGAPTERVVATSGCFDVLHLGHVELLRHARTLGDRLVVLLNSDASVTALKGPERPLNPEWDRAALLLALDVVDEVVVFDERTPCEALARLRPTVFVKGGDYEDVQIPEIATVATWGGRVEFAPLLPGRSTSRVVEVARRMVS